ncbi:hypothetical protein [Clostridium neonatale]|uniref:hypothetical protein n=1 Tax=Clostridium neonatale TaxID=137838 RepID=UPI00291C04EC|nr:hypothetical protein [Clostridium neonatale]CAI3206099.1 hypothetical protein CNEO2_500012 [Clostridium neonatale]CAI3210328.1 hypothetical protein CNEO2_430013 [Clostridium neonatale]CAI3606509.1 hypothetical protein CNEO4_230012 [Clostridium neonatale]
MAEKQNELEIRENITNGLRVFINNAVNIPQASNIIKTIFDSHFKFDNKIDLIRNLNQHIFETFKCNPSMLMNYFQFNGEISLEEFFLKKKNYEKIAKSIEEIGYKYGFFIRELISLQQSPFIIKTASFSIANGGSLHNIELTRADGKNLSAMFTSESLMLIITSMLNALEKSMTDGIYTINNEVLNGYLSSSEQLKQLINILVNQSSNDMKEKVYLNEVAASDDN